MAVVALRERISAVASKAAQAREIQVDHIAVSLEDVTTDSATFGIAFHVTRQHATSAEPFVREMIVAALQADGLLPGGQADSSSGRMDSTAPQGP
jgi:hypothetical protein